MITLSIAAAQKVLLDLDLEVAKKEELCKTVLTLSLTEAEISEPDLKFDFEKKFEKPVKRIELSRVDHSIGQITYNIYH